MSSNNKSYIREALEKLRKKLIVQRKGNNLLNFKLNERANIHICVIDELPDQIYKKMTDNESLAFKALPAKNNDELPDEQNAEFEKELQILRTTDKEYQKKYNELENSNEEKLNKEYEIERWLRNKLRAKLGLTVRESGNYSPKEWAEINNLNPSLELPLSNIGSKEKKHTDNELQTLLFVEDMERKLSSIQKKIKNDREEKGMSTLYMVFGFLEYKDSSGKYSQLAPLILFPLTMEKLLKRGKYIFKIHSNEEEPKINLALREKLKSDFDIVMPEIALEENNSKSIDFSIEKYFEEIKNKVIKNSPNNMDWSLKRIICIGRFAFQKLSMYEDLKEKNWSHIEEHPVFKRIWGGGGTPQALKVPEDLDSSPISKKVSCLINDADSSQFFAIAKALEGKNIVISGPPGTGKSQTISNIIAASLYEGKKVLFMSEKKAALDVVKKRLEEAGLGPFCLNARLTNLESP